jgi:N-acetylglutamate synthase-like GNAT family acetyltransferase
MDWIIDRASADDLEAIRSLLRTSGLSDDRVTAPRFFVARQQGRTIGCVGMETSGVTAILRSLAVDHAHRQGGVGTALVGAVRERASREGCGHVVALTVDAGLFFTRLGFRAVPRQTLDGQTLSHWQFHSGVCDSAACLALPLVPAPDTTSIH